MEVTPRAQPFEYGMTRGAEGTNIDISKGQVRLPEANLSLWNH
jgi:hypothetical protein